MRVTCSVNLILCFRVIALTIFDKECKLWSSFIYSLIDQWLYSPLLGPGLFFSFVIFFKQTVGLLGRVISTSQGRYLHIGQHKHRINAHTDIHAWVGFDTTILTFERAKTVHVIDRSATVIVMEFLIMQFSPASYFFICLVRFKCSPQYSILKHSQSVLLLQLIMRFVSIAILMSEGGA
jgi:hypothetical protein